MSIVFIDYCFIFASYSFFKLIQKDRGKGPTTSLQPVQPYGVFVKGANSCSINMEKDKMTII
jgi:hypothetical protein